MSYRIFVADDHDIVREGVKSLLKSRPEWEICGEACDGNEAYGGVLRTRPDAVVLDVSMPGKGGLDVTRELIASDPEIKILLFTMHDSISLFQTAMNIGARGVVLKSRAARDLMHALQIVLQGGTFFNPGASAEQREKRSTNNNIFRVRIDYALDMA